MMVPVSDIDKMWPLVLPFLLPAFETTNKLDTEDAKVLCEDGMAQLWIIWAPERYAVDGGIGVLMGASITSIDCYSNGYRILSFLVMGGTDTEYWASSAIEKVEEFARAEECRAVEFKGRKGWGRVFPQYKPTAWVYTKEL